MKEAADPFEGNRDPFVPETVRIHLPDGSDAIDVAATAANYAESLLPQVSNSILKQGDVLSIEFDDDQKEEFVVETLLTGSLVFGSEDIMNPPVRLNRIVEISDEPSAITFFGSAITQSGSLITPGVLRTDSFLMTDVGISTSAVRSFDIKRPDEHGHLHPVMLNRKETLVESESFITVKRAFEDISTLLETNGFKFGETQTNMVLPDGTVLGGVGFERYKKRNGNSLIYAARQGFGCAIDPQDEIWIYDAKSEMLRAMRNIPNRGIFQMAVADGVTKDLFQMAGKGYRDGTIPDWREPFLDRTSIHWLSDAVPVISYTWLSPHQSDPTITVLQAGEKVSQLLRTPKQQGKAFVEQMKANGGEDLIDAAHHFLGIDPNDESYIYDNLEVNIRLGEEPELRKSDSYLWSSKKLADIATRKLKDATSIAYNKKSAVLNVDGHTIPIRTELEKEIEKMAIVARLAIGATQQAIGSRIINRVFKGRR